MFDGDFPQGFGRAITGQFESDCTFIAIELNRPTWRERERETSGSISYITRTKFDEKIFSFVRDLQNLRPSETIDAQFISIDQKSVR